MRVNRRWVTTGSVFFLALATGHVMQNADKLQAFFSGYDRNASAEKVIETGQATAQGHVNPASVVQLSGDTAGNSVADSATAPLAMMVAPPVAERASLSDRIARLQSTGTALPTADMSCAAAGLSLSPAAGALVDVVLSAPCDRDSVVTIRHDMMELTFRTDAQGNLEVTIPALGPDAVIEAEFPGRDPLIATVAVPDIAPMYRVVLLTRGVLPVTLNAGQGSPSATVARHFGDASIPGARLAQVLSFPAGSDDVPTRVEADVTQDDCGRWLHGQVVQLHGGDPVVRDFSLAMPGCDAVGDLVALTLPKDADGAQLASATP